MAQLLGEQYFVARDIDGALIVGAKAYFFLSGPGSTATDVYEDGDLTTPFEQPVLSNSAGRFPPIYLDPAIETKMRVYDDQDVEIEPSPYDPLTNFASLIAAGVASVTGSGSGLPYVDRFYFHEEPLATEQMGIMPFAIGVTFLTNFGGWKGKVITNPSGSVIVTVKKSATTVGTITVSSGGAFTFATSLDPSVTTSQYLTFHAPADSKGMTGFSLHAKGVVT